MNMGRNFDDVLKGFAPERRARIEANADAKHKQYLAPVHRSDGRQTGDRRHHARFRAGQP